jgi:hypothetical protein
MKTTKGKTIASRNNKRLQRRKMFWVISFIIGFVLGALSVFAGYLFVNGQIASVSANIGYWYVVYGLMILLGSSLVLAKRFILIGAVLIAIPSFLVGPQSLGIYMPSWLYLALALPLGWILPIVSFIFAILGRKSNLEKSVHA